MTVFCPTIYQALKERNCPDLNLDNHIDFWYDSLNACYTNQMPISKICAYIKAIDEHEEINEHFGG